MKREREKKKEKTDPLSSNEETMRDVERTWCNRWQKRDRQIVGGVDRTKKSRKS